jgi:hypothetical protein
MCKKLKQLTRQLKVRRRKNCGIKSRNKNGEKKEHTFIEYEKFRAHKKWGKFFCGRILSVQVNRPIFSHMGQLWIQQWRPSRLAGAHSHENVLNILNINISLFIYFNIKKNDTSH